MPISDALQQQALSYDPAMGPEELHRWAQQIKSAAAQETLRTAQPAHAGNDPWLDGVRLAISHLDPLVDKSTWDAAKRERYERALARLRNMLYERERTNRLRHLQNRGRLPAQKATDHFERVLKRLTAHG